MIWEVRTVDSHTGDLDRLLSEGWEPFAAHAIVVGSADVTRYHLRRSHPAEATDGDPHA